MTDVGILSINPISLIFLILASVLVFFLINHKYQVWYLLILSCLFIASYSFSLIVYLVLYSLVNYYIGRNIPFSRYRKLLFGVGLIYNLAQLIFLKHALSLIDLDFGISTTSNNLFFFTVIMVPVGISYFTLQGIGYLINIMIGWEQPEKSFMHFLLYIIFFPRFLVGPIDRSDKFLPQIRMKHDYNEAEVIQGIRLIMFGLFKKIVIANQLGLIIDEAYGGLNSPIEYSLWIIILIQPIYLYFDFSGYTNIAIGIARAFGFTLRPNFNAPFLSENMTEFWKRFHISLSSWFHDYVFMRLLFRFRKLHWNSSFLPLLITWIFFGLWHGAAWNFMLLGLLQGVAIFFEFTSRKWRAIVFSKIRNPYRKWLGRFLTYLFFSGSLVFFFASDITSAFIFFSKLNLSMVVWPGGIKNEAFILVIVLIILGIEMVRNDHTFIFNRVKGFLFSNRITGISIRWIVYFAMLTLLIIYYNDVQPFIYFQF